MSKLLPTVDDYMSRELITFHPADDIHMAVNVLLEKRISGAPVIDDKGALLAILSKKDCLKVVYGAGYHQDWGGFVRDYMSSEVDVLESGTDIISAVDRFMHCNYRRFPVVDSGRMIGMICRHDVLRAIADISHQADISK